MVDAVIIGGGPCGLAAAIAPHIVTISQKLDALLNEYSNLSAKKPPKRV